jgi:hypothetical protein
MEKLCNKPPNGISCRRWRSDLLFREDSPIQNCSPLHSSSSTTTSHPHHRVMASSQGRRSALPRWCGGCRRRPPPSSPDAQPTADCVARCVVMWTRFTAPWQHATLMPTHTGIAPRLQLLHGAVGKVHYAYRM